MVIYLYYFLLGVYGLLLAVSLVYHLTRKAPGGDASVDWAMGILYSGGLGGFFLVALLLRKSPQAGLVVLFLPLLFIAIPKLKRLQTRLYNRIPAFPDAPPLLLEIKNKLNTRVHVRLESWFATSTIGNFIVYDTLDFYVAPLGSSTFQLDNLQTRILAYKAAYAEVVIFEQKTEHSEEHNHIYHVDIQPSTRFYKVQPDAFRSGTFQIIVE